MLPQPKQWLLNKNVIDKFQKTCPIPDHYVMVDTETTGVAKDDRVVEMALIEVKGGVVIDLWCRIFDPEGKLLHPAAAKVNHFNDETVAMFHPIGSHLDEIAKWDQKGVPWIAFNSRFDKRLLAQSLPLSAQIKSSWLCAMKLAKMILIKPTIEAKPGYRLSAVARTVGLNPDAFDLHSAVGDAMLTIGVVERLRHLWFAMHGPAALREEKFDGQFWQMRAQEENRQLSQKSYQVSTLTVRVDRWRLLACTLIVTQVLMIGAWAIG